MSRIVIFDVDKFHAILKEHGLSRYKLVISIRQADSYSTLCERTLRNAIKNKYMSVKTYAEINNLIDIKPCVIEEIDTNYIVKSYINWKARKYAPS